MAEPIPNPEPSFQAPIPGASLTTELGNRPWENPPKETSVDKVINNYLNRMQNEELVMPLLDAIKNGASITTIAESIIETAVMEGEHTIDVGVLASSIIVEYLRGAAEVANIDYKLSNMDIATSNKPKQINKRLLEEVLEEMDKKSDSPVDEEITQSAKEIKVSSKGLMSKKIDIEDDIDGN
jgi:hypothetical protein|tara:strand:- start:761 stop:1306 length:546 start_codon:yes stop_codon:yes gene_type:complete